MIINITPPSDFSRIQLKKKTKKFLFSVHDKKVLNVSKNLMLLICKRSIIVSFDENNSNDIELLRNYMDYTFERRVVGIDIENPVTTFLNKVQTCEV